MILLWYKPCSCISVNLFYSLSLCLSCFTFFLIITNYPWPWMLCYSNFNKHQIKVSFSPPKKTPNKSKLSQLKNLQPILHVKATNKLRVEIFLAKYSCKEQFNNSVTSHSRTSFVCRQICIVWHHIDVSLFFWCWCKPFLDNQQW